MNGRAARARSSHVSRNPAAVTSRCVSRESTAKFLRLRSSISGWSAE